MTRSRLRRTPDWPFLAVLTVLAVGLLGVSQHHWRKGLYVVAAAVLLGAALRLVLPVRSAGLLAVRTRVTDVVVLTTLGLVVGGLAAAVPARPV